MSTPEGKEMGLSDPPTVRSPGAAAPHPRAVPAGAVSTIVGHENLAPLGDRDSALVEPFDPSLPVRPGEMFLDKYRIDRMLGRGGMGIVVAAYHAALDQPVAIKFLGPTFTAREHAVARFTREARAAAKLRNEHVARVLDVGVLPDGSAYMIMELLEGCDLAQVLEDRGPLSVGTAVDYLLQAIDGLADAHAHGIVHRDLKPSNIFLTARVDGTPLVKLLDFGLAKVDSSTDLRDASLTAQTAVMGTPRYMSPEQVRASKLADARSDIWSLGVVLFELVTGVAPFEGDTTQELFAAVLQDPPRSMRALRDDLPAGIEAVIGGCLDRNRTTRFQTVGELARALAPFAPPRSRAVVDRFLNEGKPLESVVPPPPATMVNVRTTALRPAGARGDNMSQTPWSVESSESHRRSMAAAGIGIIALVALLIGAWFLRDHRGDAASTNPAASIAATPDLRNTAPMPPPPGAEADASGAASAASAPTPHPPALQRLDAEPPFMKKSSSPIVTDHAVVAPSASVRPKAKGDVLENRE